ncbi:phage major capsid protein [Rhodopirellula bahusiensis]|uniref:Uncharacterized protein n=1 Tax=Rhodopirellula bahusiensis TaxID=2014065 RepID=A0A2G1W5L3_9BACT|nr:hypothetical protein [Rhodopirellula bahusiensis]PHQ34316.1 hypothetical protein CEE69_14935 [Rhodopirellula bahusiensis]
MFGTTQPKEQFAIDAINALAYRSTDRPTFELSKGAEAMANKPLWAIAAECLQHAGHQVDIYGNPELIAERAMQLGGLDRVTSFAANEDRRYIGASGSPNATPGDFPNILSGLANKFLDTVELDDDYSFDQVSALMPNALNDFKPMPLINRGTVDELDELQDAEQFKEIGLEEEVLSYVFVRRFGNKFGWTPKMIADDDMNAFSEGMLGLQEAWQTTQNRLVLDRFTSNENLLDGFPLFADRPNVGTATNNNIRSGGAVPSDSEWGEMETLYSDIGGIGTQQRVRGSLNTILTPTGAPAQAARRTFFPLNRDGLENKVATTTENVGLYRGEVAVVPESELRSVSASTWYGMRSPTRLRTATVVRGYFKGYGTQGRRERWYDPGNKTIYVSIEGRIAAAVKNWRYAVKNQTA